MYETGEREPNFEMLRKIAFVLGVSTSDLLGETEQEPAETVANQPPEIRMIARAGQRMDPAKRAEMVRILKAIFPDEFKDEHDEM